MRWLRQGRRGQSTVEFALIGSMLFLLLFGIFEVARLTYGFSAITSGAREGARWAVATANRPGPNTTACDATLPGLTAAVRSQLSGLTPAPTIAATEDSATPPGWCQVTVTWSFQPITGGLDGFPPFSVVSTSRQYYN